jgi:serine protease inhibitor
MSLVILSEHLLSINPHKNIFLSSISIAIALATTYNGSSGMTKNKIAETLGIQEKSLHQIIKANADLSRKLLGSDQEKIILANSLWIKEGVILKDLFKRNISKEECR